MKSYDLIVIGSGSGLEISSEAAELGLSVAVVEQGPFGGTCLNAGCIPSKALLESSELYHRTQHEFATHGINVGKASFDLGQMQKRKNDISGQLTGGIRTLFKANGVEGLEGTGSLAGNGKVRFQPLKGEARELSAKHIVVATGSSPVELKKVAPFDGDRVCDSWDALDFDKVPKKLGIIGAGVIGVELGSVWSRLGSEVTILEAMPEFLPAVDAQVSKDALRQFGKQGLDIKLNAKVTGAKSSKSGVELTVEPAKGGEAETLKGDVVLVAIGRRPYTEGLGLETVGLSTDKRGFLDNDHFRTGTDGIWVVGDVTHGPMLAHKAEEDAVAAIETIAGKAGHVDYNLVPGVVYTSPEVAWIGQTEDQLKAAGVAYKVGKFPFTANSRAKINHETDGFAKVLADAETDKVLGVHIMGPQAGEMIHEAAMCMAFGGSSEDIARTCHAHPTRSEAVRQAAMGVEGWTMQA